MVVLGQSGCVQSKVVYYGKKCCNLESGCTPLKVVVIEKSGRVRAKFLYSDKSGFIRGKWLYTGKNSCFRETWFYSGKKCCIRARVVLFGQ